MDPLDKPPMKDQVPVLRSLQDIDRQIFRWTKDRAAKPRMADPIDREVAGKKSDHDARAKELAAIRSEMSKRELDVKEREERRKRLEGQRDQSKSNKEYQGYNFEIAAIRTECGKIEEEVLKLMSAAEESTAKVAESKELLAAAQGKQAEVRKVVDAEVAKIDVEIKALRDRRSEAAAQVHPEYIKLYDRIYKSKPDGVAVTCVTKDGDVWHCGGCRMEITFQDLNVILKGKDAVTCRSCSRLLYTDAKPEAASAKKG